MNWRLVEAGKKWAACRNGSERMVRFLDPVGEVKGTGYEYQAVTRAMGIPVRAHARLGEIPALE